MMLALLANAAWAEVKPVLRMAMPEYPPYTYVQDGQYQGEGYDAFVFIMRHLQREFEILLVPNYGRAVTDLQNNLIDGLFSPRKMPSVIAWRYSPIRLVLPAGPGFG
ncbi:hypothetical protein ALON55S_02657 [Alishewanella longhuensis]